MAKVDARPGMPERGNPEVGEHFWGRDASLDLEGLGDELLNGGVLFDVIRRSSVIFAFSLYFVNNYQLDISRHSCCYFIVLGE